MECMFKQGELLQKGCKTLRESAGSRYTSGKAKAFRTPAGAGKSRGGSRAGKVQGGLGMRWGRGWAEWDGTGWDQWCQNAPHPNPQA